MSSASRETNRMQSGKSFSLFLLTWPIFLEMFLFMLMGSVDTLMLSAVSDDAVAGVGVANQYIFITILILEVIANGASIVVSQYLGSKRPDEAAKITAIAITLNLALGLAISLGFVLFGNPLLRAVNLEGDILAHGQTYLSIVGGWLVLQALINTLTSVIRVHGYTRQTMYVSVGMNVANVVGNYALIFGHWGFPEMGVAGAAISTVASRALGLVVLFALLYRLLEVRIRMADYVRMSREYVRNILKIGIPSALEQVTYHVCQSVFLYYVTFVGASALASRQYVMNISQFIFLFSAAVGIGTAIITGRLVGAGRKEEAYAQVWSSLRWGFGITLLINVAAIAFREPLIEFFTDDPDIVKLTSQIILLSIFLETGRTFNMILINSLRAAGDAKYPVYIGLVSMVGMSLPLGYFLTFTLDLGLAGVWLAIAADEWLRGIIMLFRWRSRAWERHALVQPDAPASAASGATAAGSY